MFGLAFPTVVEIMGENQNEKFCHSYPLPGSPAPLGHPGSEKFRATPGWDTKKNGMGEGGWPEYTRVVLK